MPTETLHMIVVAFLGPERSTQNPGAQSFNSACYADYRQTSLSLYHCPPPSIFDARSELTGLGCQKRKRKRKKLEAVLSTIGDYHSSVEYPHQN
ncbi:hypothetical protein I7I48_07035 [Histoplasma ohiense]|nr:hypothetical protein I7I48_07035 [Histoplasma ohiense (nom. inval.)]